MSVKIDQQSSRLSDIIRFHRRRAGLSRIDLATLAGIGKTALYDIENGKQTMRWNTLMQLLQALNIQVWLDSPLMDFMDKEHETS